MKYSPFRHAGSILWKRDPVHLTFFVTKRCNARCPYCFYLKTPDAVAPSLPELSLGEIERVSRSLGSLLWLAFSGGEIFLREDLVEITEAFYRNNKPAFLLYPTNGLLPELIRDRMERILKDCPKSVVAVKLSLDGIGQDHDDLRNTPGSFERTLETYRLLSGLLDRYPRFELGVNTVFCSGNQDDMEKIIDFVGTLDRIRTHTVSLVRGNLVDKGYKDVDHEKYFRAIERLERDARTGRAPVYRFGGARIKAAQDLLQRRLIHRTLREGTNSLPCYAGRVNLVLTETGEVLPCEILTESWGNVRDYGYDLKKVMSTEKAKAVLSNIRERGCSCTHECTCMTNILFNPRMYPSLARAYLSLAK